MASLIGPLAVPYDDKYQDDDVDVPDSVVDDTIDHIHNYMVWSAVVAAAEFFLLLAYFPARPKRPPSVTTMVERTDFVGGWRLVLRNRQLWLVGLALSIPGMQYGWQSIMAIVFEDFGVTDREVANIMFLSVVCQAAAVAVVGLAMDHFRDRLKPSVFVLLTTSCLSYVWLALLILDVIPYSLPQLYVSTVVATTGFVATLPLFFELALMISYPIPEGLVGAYLTGLLNLMFTAFLLVLMVPDMDYTWVTYVLITCTVAAIPLVYAIERPEDYIKSKQ